MTSPVEADDIELNFTTPLTASRDAPLDIFNMPPCPDTVSPPITETIPPSMLPLLEPLSTITSPAFAESWDALLTDIIIEPDLCNEPEPDLMETEPPSVPLPASISIEPPLPSDSASPAANNTFEP